MQTRTMPFLVAAALLAAVTAAQAQTSAASAAAGRPARPIFLDLNAALEGAAPAIETSNTFRLFGETGAAATREEPPTSAMADARLGYWITDRVGIAFGFAGGRSETVGKAAASVPSPIRFASPTILNLDAPGLKRREADYNVQVVWRVPVNLPHDAALLVAGGPSIVQLQQSIASVDTGAQTPSVVVDNEKGTAFGGHVGVDLVYPITDAVGIGLFVRYVGGHLDLPSAADVKVGGAQAGGGIRLRF